jgi:hypothetical protein
MKPRNLIKSNLVIALLLALVSAPALANDATFGLFGAAAKQYAQFTAEERRVLRERWEEASPEQRLQMRREFQERQERMRLRSQDGRIQPERNQRDGNWQRGDFASEGSFGTGFERRRSEGSQFEGYPPDYVPSMPSPGSFFDGRSNRGGKHP